MDIKPVKKNGKKFTKPQTSALKNNQNGTNNPNDFISLKSKTSPKIINNKNQKSNISRIFLWLRKQIFGVILFALLLAIYIFPNTQLNSNQQYESILSQSSSLTDIENNSSFAAQKSIFLVGGNLHLLNKQVALGFSLFFTLAVLFVFYKVIKHWLGKIPAFLTTAMMGCSTWIILKTQSLSFDGAYLLFLPLVIYLYYLIVKEASYIYLLALSLLLGFSIYSPGMIWLVIGFSISSLLFSRKIIVNISLKHLIFVFISFVLTLLPLAYLLISNTNNFSIILTGSEGFDLNLWQNLQVTFSDIFYNGLNDSSLWLVGTPIINYVTLLLFFLGSVYLVTDKKFQQHLSLILILFIASIAAIAFVGELAISLILPAIYFVSAFGVKFLLDNWLSIFPKNPFAKNLSLALVSVVVILSCAYGISRYHLVWPKTVSIAEQNSN